MYIGLDLGTSSLKAILIDDDQSILAEHAVPLTVSRPQDGWSEQDPSQWFAATDLAMKSLAAQTDLSAVRGIGLAGHMHGATLLDDADKVLRPCILWNDTRSADEASALDSDPQFRDLSGNIVFAGFTAPKTVWVKNNEPKNFAKLAKVLLPKDYLRLLLIGDHVAEMSDAAGTSWLDVAKRDWSDDLLNACDLDRSHMP
ncbi:FGGY family carbohydrate kinase, partial [Planktotalea frisia]|nr:FGGY family carbohydrate kinase [Planktotalea frisia]